MGCVVRSYKAHSGLANRECETMESESGLDGCGGVIFHLSPVNLGEVE